MSYPESTPRDMYVIMDSLGKVRVIAKLPTAKGTHSESMRLTMPEAKLLQAALGEFLDEIKTLDDLLNSET